MTFYAIDRTRVPNASLKVLARLGKTLVRDRLKPEHVTETIEIATEKLQICITEVDTATTGRVREINPEIIASEVQFDRGTDTQWVWLRKLLEGIHAAYGHPGLDALPKPLQEAAGLPALRNKAERAHKLHQRLFGAEGTNWVQRPYIEQVETMGSLLRLIKADGLEDELKAVVGPDLPVLLVVCQEHYETMVGDRMSRSGRPADDFGELRAKLRWKIDRYKNAVETLRDDEKPASFEIVDRALRSLIMLAERVTTTSGAENQDDLLGEGLVELDQVDEAFEAENDAEAEAQADIETED